MAQYEIAAAFWILKNYGDFEASAIILEKCKILQ